MKYPVQNWCGPSAYGKKSSTSQPGLVLMGWFVRVESPFMGKRRSRGVPWWFNCFISIGVKKGELRGMD